MPQVSVIIPTYNRSKLVAQAIRSVLAQTYEDYEVIVVDDGSTDDTREVVEGFGDPRIVYLWQENQQRCAARNNGVAHAQGSYIAFLDSDDVWFPNKLQRQMEAFAKYPQVGLVFSSTVRISGENTFPNPAEFLQPDGETVASIREDLLTMNRIPMVTSIVRKELLDQAGKFDKSLPHAEDWDMWIRISKNADFCRINAPLAAYRVHAGMRTSNPVSTLRGDLIIIDRYLGDGSDSSNRLRQRAEMLCYARRAFEAAMNDMPEATEWLTQAQARAIALGEPEAVAQWVTTVALSRATMVESERKRLAAILHESLVTLRDGGAGPGSVATGMQHFWGACVRQDFRLKDYPATLRMAWHALTSQSTNISQLRLLAVAARAAVRHVLEHRKGRIVPLAEKQLCELLAIAQHEVAPS
jgi:glycosyltransferase involved in cell wall biosynthesis